MHDDRPGYYAVIPADVRYDDRIPANAKLLYGEISALTDMNGFCFAGNEYFARLYGLSERTITGLIKALKDNGHIHVDLKKDDSGKIISRRIWLRVSATDGQPVEKIFYTPRKNFREGIEKICGDINTSIIDIDIKENKKEKSGKKKDTPPKTDFEPMSQFVDWIGRTFPDYEAGAKNELYKAFVRFVQNRVALKKPYKTEGAVTGLCNKLVKYAKSDIGLMVELLDNATEHSWQTVFPLNSPPPEKSQPKGGRVYECL